MFRGGLCAGAAAVLSRCFITSRAAKDGPGSASPFPNTANEKEGRPFYR